MVFLIYNTIRKQSFIEYFDSSYIAVSSNMSYFVLAVYIYSQNGCHTILLISIV